jgi:hypothetical protein
MALTRLGLNQSINLATNITGTLATGNGGTGATSFAPGKVLQVINATDSTEKVVASSTYVDTGLSATITPSSSSNKILVFAAVSSVGKASSNTNVRLKLLRGSTDLIIFTREAGQSGNSDDNKVGNSGCTYLDSPNTSSATTYKVQMNSNSGSSYGQTGGSGGTHTMTLMEIEA